MITFERILFPVDLSKQGREAAPFVRAMAQRFQSELILLHVAAVPPAWYGVAIEGPVFEPIVDLTALVKQRRADLDAYLAGEFRGLTVRRRLEQGDPAGVIVDLAREEKAGLIMMPITAMGLFEVCCSAP